MSTIRISHRPSGTLLAEGPSGLRGITRFEGNYYVPRRHLRTDGFVANGVPGFCPYKFLYVWLDLRLPDHPPVRFLAWRYVLANPLFWFVWWRVGLPANHPQLEVDVTDP